jgi:hypothetical protein
VKCEHCGTVFCWDGADRLFLGGLPRRFCSPQCKRSAKQCKRSANRGPATRKARQVWVCTRRKKISYPTEKDALLAAGPLSRSRGVVLSPYECACGSWHLTSKPSHEGIAS